MARRKIVYHDFRVEELIGDSVVVQHSVDWLSFTVKELVES